jgi:hypothetical protein
MHDFADSLERRHGLQEWVDYFLPPENDEAYVGAPLHNLRQAGQHHVGTVVASHGVNGNPDHAALLVSTGGRRCFEVWRK